MTSLYLNPNLPGDLKSRWPDWQAGNARRAIAAQKKTIYDGNHLGMIVDYLRKTVSGTQHAQVAAFASRSANILRSVTDTISVVHRRGCNRFLYGASEATAKAFATLVRESGITERANALNAMSWLKGPVIITPHIDPRNKLGIDIITPDLVELRRTGKYIDAVLWRHGAEFIELDDEAYRYYDAKGNLYDVKPHNTGFCPAAAYVSMDNSTEFWNSTATLGLVDVTLQVACSLAYGRWVRQVSGNNLTVVLGELGDVPAGQSVGDYSSVVTTNAPAQDADVKVLSRVVPADDRLKEIANDIALAVSQYGIPPSAISMMGGQEFSIKVEGDRLSILRDRQVPFCLAAEREFWEAACEYVRTSSHKLAGSIPKPDEVREMLRIEFPDLASNDDIKARTEAMAAGLPYGITNPRSMLAAARPERTNAEIEEEMQENLKLYIDLIKPLVERNTPVNASQHAKGYQSVPQEQGREGGIASGESRAGVAKAA